MDAQKAYKFDIGLGRDESPDAGGPYNNATVNVVWVKGFFNGQMYLNNTLIIQARVQYGDATFWESAPIIRTDLTPAATTLMFNLSVESGNHFSAGVGINAEVMQTLGVGGYTLTAGQGTFQRFPDLYPYIYMEERSASTAPQASVQSQRWQNDGNYYAGLYVMDPLHLASAVTVTGYNNVNNYSLFWDDVAKAWYNNTPVLIGSTYVTDPWPSYTFNFTPQSGGAPIASVTKSVTGYVTEFATDLSPSGDVTTAPVFSWTPAQGTISGYGIEVNDSSTGSRVWSLYDIPAAQTSVPYVGPALKNGNTYNYNIIAYIENQDASNASFASGSFTYAGTGGGISFSGSLLYAVDNAPVSDGQVEMAGNPSIYTTTDPTGAFTLTGLPANTPLSVKLSHAGYVPTCTHTFQSQSPIVAARSYSLFTPQDLQDWGTASGTGVIHGRVMNSANLGAGYVSGAHVSYASSEGHNYRVMYEDVYGTIAPGEGTHPNGRFYILDIAEGDIVTVTAQQGNYLFQPAVFGNETDRTHGGSVYQGLVEGTAVSGRVAIGGHIMTYDPVLGFKSVIVEQVGATNPSNATTSDGDGFFYLSVPQSTALQLKFSKPQAMIEFAPTCSADMTFGSDNPDIGDFNLFTKTKLTALPPFLTGGWGMTADTGIIRARVKDPSGNYLAGATVTAQGNSKTYQVCYDDDCTSGLTATQSGGRYVVKNVDDGDTVTVTAQKAGWTFNIRTFPIHGSSVHQGSVTGIISAGGGEGNINFTTTNPDLNWSAIANDLWITITGGSTGTGNGTVTYMVTANPSSDNRTGSITIDGQTYAITQAGTGIVPPWVGAWGVQQLIHFDDGYNEVGGIAVPWYAEVDRTTLNEDGTGTMVMKKNDHNGELVEQTVSFNYTMVQNADGSLTFSGNVGEGYEQLPFSTRMVVGDDGKMGIIDGTLEEHQQKLMVLYRIDTTKTYSAADVNGEYYNLGFERNNTGVVDPPNGNGAFMAISGIHTFNGSGSYTCLGKANSVTSTGTNLIWEDDQTATPRSYSVAADGTFTAGSGAFQGSLTGDSLVGGGAGAFVQGVNNQVAYFFLKKGDRTYSTADLAGKWALVSFGQDSRTIGETIQGFYSSFGTMTCDAAGSCTFKLKNRNSDNSTDISEDSVVMAVNEDGSFGTSLGEQSPSYAGSIGNNGNTILVNPSLRYASGDDPWNREIIIGIRASEVGDLAGGATGSPLRGNINGDSKVDLADAILALQVMAGMNPSGVRANYPLSGADVNGDGKVGPQELLYILQYVAGNVGT
jgi:hypothetical protein